MRIAWILPLAVACMAVVCPAPAAEAASPLSWLGFGKHQSQPVKTTNVAQTSRAPAVVAKMTGGTKRLVNNTKSLFVAKKAPVKRQGLTATHRAQRPEPPKQGFFQQLFHPEPPPPPKTVNEWMSLKQLHP